MLKINSSPSRISAGWVKDFRKKHKMRQRRVTNYISSEGNATFEETVKSCLNVSKTESYSNPTELSLTV
jgi:hypothetical protein